MKKIVIIGGGIAGLTAGIFARKSGFESVILERHYVPGGECMGWDRQGYHIDGCIHWLVGIKEGTPLRRLWDRVGALDGVKIHHPESFMAVEHDGVSVHLYRDLDRLRESWIELSPGDRGSIEEFCRDIQQLHSFTFPVGKPMDLMGFREKIRFMLSMRDVDHIMRKYGKMTVADLAERFRHPALRNAIASFLPEGDFSAASIMFPLGTFTGGQSSIPIGGSKGLTMRMADRYRSLGGVLETSCEAVDLKIRGKRVENVICRDGRVVEGDYVIAACDARVLYHHLLRGKYPDPEFEKRYNDPKRYPLVSNIYVGIGYEGTMEDIPRSFRFPVKGVDIRQNRKPVEHLQITHYHYEPCFAPVGHSVITVAINQFEPELQRWQDLGERRDAYREEKTRIGKEVARALETRFPHMEGKLRVLDVATPHSYSRFCNAYKGAFMSFWPTIHGRPLNHTGRIGTIDNLFLSGQWLQPPGGLPVALVTGKDTIMRICRMEGIELGL